jgi:hypothetical protein
LGSLSDTAETAVGKAIFQNTTYTSGSPLFLCLGTAATETTFTEVANSNAYARLSVTMNATNWPEDGTIKGKFTNGIALTTVTATGSWGTPTVWALATSGTYGGGTIVVYGDIDPATQQPITSGQAANFAAGTIVATID